MTWYRVIIKLISTYVCMYEFWINAWWRSQELQRNADNNHAVFQARILSKFWTSSGIQARNSGGIPAGVVRNTSGIPATIPAEFRLVFQWNAGGIPAGNLVLYQRNAGNNSSGIPVEFQWNSGEMRVESAWNSAKVQGGIPGLFLLGERFRRFLMCVDMAVGSARYLVAGHAYFIISVNWEKVSF